MSFNLSTNQTFPPGLVKQSIAGWSEFLNTYGVWWPDINSLAPVDFVMSAYFPTSGPYIITAAADNAYDLYIDNQLVLANTNWTAVDTKTVSYTAGTKSIRVVAKNFDNSTASNPGAVAVTIVDNSTGKIVWGTTNATTPPAAAPAPAPVPTTGSGLPYGLVKQTYSGWPQFLNTYGVWYPDIFSTTPVNYTVSLSLPNTGNYTIKACSDNAYEIKINSQTVLTGNNFNIVDTVTVSYPAQAKASLEIYAVNSGTYSGGNPGAVAVTITDDTTGSFIYTTTGGVYSAPTQTSAPLNLSGGGGGAGQVLNIDLTADASIRKLNVGTYKLRIGGGGVYNSSTKQSTNGGNTSLIASDKTLFTAYGGGAGGGSTGYPNGINNKLEVTDTSIGSYGGRASGATGSNTIFDNPTQTGTFGASGRLSPLSAPTTFIGGGGGGAGSRGGYNLAGQQVAEYYGGEGKADILGQVRGGGGAGIHNLGPETTTDQYLAKGGTGGGGSFSPAGNKSPDGINGLGGGGAGGSSTLNKNPGNGGSGCALIAWPKSLGEVIKVSGFSPSTFNKNGIEYYLLTVTTNNVQGAEYTLTVGNSTTATPTTTPSTPTPTTPTTTTPSPYTPGGPTVIVTPTPTPTTPTPAPSDEIFLTSTSFLPGVYFTIVAGGGGGGSGIGGGGGAGAVITKSNISLSPGIYYATIGAGGSFSGIPGDPGTNGGDSKFNNTIAIGGGGGGGTGGRPGGSGGGGGAKDQFAATLAGGTGLTEQGNSGGNAIVVGSSKAGGGGGGASTPGGNGGAQGSIGGTGIRDITGTLRAAGGGGAQNPNAYSLNPSGGTGGSNIGGRGEQTKLDANNNIISITEQTLLNAKNGTGSGGGGAYFLERSQVRPGNGGSGCLILAWPQYLGIDRVSVQGFTVKPTTINNLPYLYYEIYTDNIQGGVFPVNVNDPAPTPTPVTVVTPTPSPGPVIVTPTPSPTPVVVVVTPTPTPTPTPTTPTPTPTPTPTISSVISTLPIQYLDPYNYSTAFGNTWVATVGNDATLVNNPVFGTYANAKSFRFGYNYAKVDPIGLLNKWTLEAWINIGSPVNTGPDMIITDGEGRGSIIADIMDPLTQSCNFVLGFNTPETNEFYWSSLRIKSVKRLDVGFWKNGRYYGTGIVAPTGWTHVVGTFDGTVCKLFVNGSLSAGSGPLEPCTGGTKGFRIGANWTTDLSAPVYYKTENISGAISTWIDDKRLSYYYGDIGLVRIYDTALTETDIASLFNENKFKYGLGSVLPTNVATSTTPNGKFWFTVVGGGGAGGGDDFGGGGGAGGLITQGPIALEAGAYTAIIGGGGIYVSGKDSDPGQNGQDSSFYGIVAAGGGGGGAKNGAARNGGSGGGGSGSYNLTNPGIGKGTQGYQGGAGLIGTSQSYGGGGGGAGGVGIAAPASKGGKGALDCIGIVRAGGGGAFCEVSFAAAGSGGSGGGGSYTNGPVTNGVNGFGGGGAGGNMKQAFQAPGNGGSGCVVIAWPQSYGQDRVTCQGFTPTSIVYNAENWYYLVIQTGSNKGGVFTVNIK